MVIIVFVDIAVVAVAVDGDGDVDVDVVVTVRENKIEWHTTCDVNMCTSEVNGNDVTRRNIKYDCVWNFKRAHIEICDAEFLL